MRFLKRSRIEAPAAAVFRFHEAPDALARLTPPWQPAEVVERSGGLEVGARVVLSLRIGPLHLRWVAEHDRYEPGREFRDVQVEGPFARWVHTHRFVAIDERSSILEDDVDYALPLGWIGSLFGGWFARREIERLFEFRHRVTAETVSGRPPSPA